jgi:hypothetical protein
MARALFDIHIRSHNGRREHYFAWDVDAASKHRRPESREAWIGPACLDATEPSSENSSNQAEAGSWLVQPEAVGDCGRLAATGHPELGEDVGDVQAGGLLSDEQRLADLPVGPAGSD